MKPRILFIIESDPRVSHRPVEAMRIAAGVGVWGKIEMQVYLGGPAVLMLSGRQEELVNGEDLGNYLTMMEQAGTGLYVQAGNVLPGNAAEGCPDQEMSDVQLAGLAAECNTVVHF